MENYTEHAHRLELKRLESSVAMALHDAGGGSIIEDETAKLKKEIASLKRRLTSALKQRDEWAVKYAGVMQNANEKKS